MLCKFPISKVYHCASCNQFLTFCNFVNSNFTTHIQLKVCQIKGLAFYFICSMTFASCSLCIWSTYLCLCLLSCLLFTCSQSSLLCCTSTMLHHSSHLPISSGSLFLGHSLPFMLPHLIASLPMHKLPKTHFPTINFNLLSKRNPQRQRSMKLIGHYTGGQLGHFHDMCVKYTPSKCVEFNFGFHFCMFGCYKFFHKINVM